MTFTLQQLLDHARRRPPGYIEDILAAAGITESVQSLSPSATINLQPATFNQLRAKYQPTLHALATDYQNTTQPWRVGGIPVLDETAADARADTCALCAEFRLKDGRLICRAWGCEPLMFWLKSTPCLFQKWTSGTPV